VGIPPTDQGAFYRAEKASACVNRFSWTRVFQIKSAELPENEVARQEQEQENPEIRMISLSALPPPVFSVRAYTQSPFSGARP
jgi:hypothetical protein